MPTSFKPGAICSDNSEAVFFATSKIERAGCCKKILSASLRVIERSAYSNGLFIGAGNITANGLSGRDLFFRKRVTASVLLASHIK